MKKIAILIVGLSLIVPILALAKIGVGVGTGKIVMDQTLKPGLIYTLPTLVVLNTGDEPSDYEVSITYRENQPELKPSKEWFSFKPSKFYLEPGKNQAIQIKLSLPVNGAKPGNYFAFLESHPVKKTVNDGGTSVGVAAAAKLYFTVEPANFFVGVYYRLTSIFTLYAPWSYVVLAVLVAALLVTLSRRYFSFNIGIKPKKK